MNITIQPGKLRGTVAAIPSKSQAHRLLICAAFADKETRLRCEQTNRDIEATAACLNALGAKISRTDWGYVVSPVCQLPETARLNCCESGSTLRFMLPVVGALGVETTFYMEGRLPQRPLSPLWEEMERMGCHLTRPTVNTLHCSGKLIPGAYQIDGGVSSQFITGLLLALSLLPEESQLTVTGKVESKPYIDITRQALRLFGVNPDRLGTQRFSSPGELTVEGDWSNGAFFLAAKALGSNLTVTGLDPDSPQGDRAADAVLSALIEGHTTVCAADIPDLIPILAVTAGALHGAVFTHIARLRLKESDRVAAICSMISALGGKCEADENTLTVYPTGYVGGTVDAFGDHRIAMSAAIAATVCREPVTVLGAQAVEKSYPDFWAQYRRLGGIL